MRPAQAGLLRLALILLSSPVELKFHVDGLNQSKSVRSEKMKEESRRRAGRAEPRTSRSGQDAGDAAGPPSLTLMDSQNEAPGQKLQPQTSFHSRLLSIKPEIHICPNPNHQFHVINNLNG